MKEHVNTRAQANSEDARGEGVKFSAPPFACPPNFAHADISPAVVWYTVWEKTRLHQGTLTQLDFILILILKEMWQLIIWQRRMNDSMIVW